MAEEFKMPKSEDLDMQATQAVDVAADETQVVYEAADAPTQTIDSLGSAETVAFTPMPTERLDAVTEQMPAPVNPTTPMPNPYPEPESTVTIPNPSATMSGFDVPVASRIGEEPATPVAPPEPYTAAATAAAAGFGAASAAQTPPQPAAPEQQGSYRGQYQQQYRQPTYAQPDFTQGAYQSAVQHQSFAPDPTVNPYEWSLTQLTGGLKFGWLLIGLFMGIPGMLLAWLVTADKHPQVKHDAIMWSGIGFAIAVVFAIITCVAVAGLMAAAISAASSGDFGSFYF